MNKIKKNDQVVVIAGKNKGATGSVQQVKGERVVVSGVNLIKKHVKPNPMTGEAGGIVEKEASIHISNVMLVEGDARVKVGFKVEEKDGKTVRTRYSKKSNAEI